ncbi:MAG: hypothetical protein LBH14_06335 [Desulfobulbaceae bacterium]|jgi:hypothetical protein|nr:hypothetical protein [Desulfobulbaceae bacterium]
MMRTVEKSVIVLLLLCFAITPAFAGNSSDYPGAHGWRLPAKPELDDSWRISDGERYAVVAGNFHDDGHIEKVGLLVSRDKKCLGLFLLGENKTQNSRPIFIDCNPGAIDFMGIKKVSPGKYMTACGKGYWECDKNESPEIEIKHDAIEYFKTEGASSYFVWNRKNESFDRIWMND